MPGLFEIELLLTVGLLAVAFAFSGALRGMRSRSISERRVLPDREIDGGISPADAPHRPQRDAAGPPAAQPASVTAKRPERVVLRRVLRAVAGLDS